MPKAARHFAIKEIITTKAIPSQDELRRELRKRGFTVTQATLSRDLQELGVGRVTTGHETKYIMPQRSDPATLLPLVAREVVSIAANESVIVIRTLPGGANTVGEYLDVLDHRGIIGTVAGDNTLLVIPHSEKATRGIVHYLKEKLFEGA
ncbi:MAG: arginine repressor [Ignavibacteria bacterium]|nr:arginine repressor [Ignavibacteria bacterium]